VAFWVATQDLAATTLPMHAALAANAEFAAGGVPTDFLAGWLGLQTGSVRDKKDG
jgi:hypothetical protein